MKPKPKVNAMRRAPPQPKSTKTAPRAAPVRVKKEPSHGDVKKDKVKPDGRSKMRMCQWHGHKKVAKATPKVKEEPPQDTRSPLVDSSAPKVIPPRRTPSEIARDPVILTKPYRYAEWWQMHTMNRRCPVCEDH